jgi:hypothetical protein
MRTAMPWGPSSCFSAAPSSPPSPLFFLLRPSSTPPAGTAIPASQQQPPFLLRPSTHIPYGLRGRGEGLVSSSLLSQAHIPYGLRGREEGLVSSSSHVPLGDSIPCGVLAALHSCQATSPTGSDPLGSFGCLALMPSHVPYGIRSPGEFRLSPPLMPSNSPLRDSIPWRVSAVSSSHAKQQFPTGFRLSSRHLRDVRPGLVN